MPTLSENVTDSLRDWVLHGRLKPGERIEEVPIAKALGVSFNILEGVIGRIKDTPYGQLTVQVIGSAADVGRVEAAFAQQSIHCEVLGS